MSRLVVHGRAVLIACLFLALPARGGQLSPFGGSLVTLHGAIDRAAFDDGGIEYTVPAGGDLQAAIDGAQPGDTILLTPGATYEGSFNLWAKDGDGFITIRSAAPDSSLPGAGVRMTPDYVSQLPRVQGGIGGAPAFV